MLTKLGEHDNQLTSLLLENCPNICKGKGREAAKKFFLLSGPALNPPLIVPLKKTFFFDFPNLGLNLLIHHHPKLLSVCPEICLLNAGKARKTSSPPCQTSQTSSQSVTGVTFFVKFFAFNSKEVDKIQN